MEYDIVQLVSSGSLTFGASSPFVATGGSSTALWEETHTNVVGVARPDYPHSEQTTSVPRPVAGPMVLTPHTNSLSFLTFDAVIVVCAAGAGWVAFREHRPRFRNMHSL